MSDFVIGLFPIVMNKESFISVLPFSTHINDNKSRKIIFFIFITVL